MTEEMNTPASEDAADPKTKRLSESDYAEARELYELGKMRLSELGEKFDVSRQALWRRFKQDGVEYGSRAAEVSAAASAGVKAATTAAAAQQTAQVERYNEKRAEWIEETRTNGYKALKQADMLAKKIVAEALTKKSPMSTTDDDLKAVHRFQKILVENTLTRLDILRANDLIDEDDLPEIHFEDLTDDDILAHHKDNGLIDESEDPDAILAEINSVELPT
ncbi:hypothetical protein HJA82_29000 [Rhizobium bangladeshense]|uniref:hypothetical protein n=1 Tax=Rhizobium TaxID=379 RepID=UPI001C83FEE6|nr:MULTISPECIES: hypothetical protein [Rhizobium]MBX4911352.1 hypothetical protein [Rhizobium bangladeshense]MBX5130812.1 hypothetical protein [Rhizobium lentis]